MVENCRQNEANECPESAEQSNPSPCSGRLRGDELRPKHRGAERYYGEDEDGDVLAPLAGRCQFRSHSQCSQFVDTSTHTGEDHAADEDIHGLCSGAHNHAQDEKDGSYDGNPSSTYDIGDGPNERTNSGQGEEVGKHEPNPSVDAANVAVDLGRDATEEVHGYLTSSPYYAMLVKLSEALG